MSNLVKRQPIKIYDTLLKLADGTLEHFVEDLTHHDRRFLETVETGTTWLWIVHKCGTHLARWDEDAYAGSKDSHLEALIRQGCFGMWPTHKAFLIQITGRQKKNSPGALGFIGKVSLQHLQTKLPRPKPEPKLPKFKSQQQVYSASFALASL